MKRGQIIVTKENTAYTHTVNGTQIWSNGAYIIIDEANGDRGKMYDCLEKIPACYRYVAGEVRSAANKDCLKNRLGA